MNDRNSPPKPTRLRPTLTPPRLIEVAIAPIISAIKKPSTITTKPAAATSEVQTVKDMQVKDYSDKPAFYFCLSIEGIEKHLSRENKKKVLEISPLAEDARSTRGQE